MFMRPSVKPRRLKQGSTIMVVAPAGDPLDPSNGEGLSLGIQLLRKMGFRVVLGDTVRFAMRRWYHSAPDEVRARDLNNAFARDDVDAIWCLKGMSGSLRVIRYLDYDLIKRNPKVLVGFSDITSIQAAIYSRAGLPSIQGPMLDYTPTSEAALARFRRDLDLVVRMLMGEVLELKPPEDSAFPRTINPGKAKGPVIGGNLLKFLLVQATPYRVDSMGKVVFLEEIPIWIHRLDEYLTALGLDGTLGGSSAIVYGEFPESRDWQIGGSVTEVLVDAVKTYAPGKPTFMNYPCCHGSETYPIPLGTEVEVNADETMVRMSESVTE